MTEYKIKIYDQLTRTCCLVIECESHILQEAKEESSRKVADADLPNGEYYYQLYRIGNPDEKEYPETPEWPFCKK